MATTVEECIFNFRNSLRAICLDEDPILEIHLADNASLMFRDEIASQCKYVKRESFDLASWIVFMGVKVYLCE